MFNFFKKPAKDPAHAQALYDEFQRRFATDYPSSVVAKNLGAVVGMIGSGDFAGILKKSWTQLWKAIHPREPAPAPEGLQVHPFQENGKLLAFIIYPPSTAEGGVFYGIIVIGPCEDPNWSEPARSRAPFRYFVLARQGSGAVVEEWTSGQGVPMGDLEFTGTEPHPSLFTEWVMNCCVRSPGDVVQMVSGQDEDMVAAIARAQQELPAVLEKFLAGELDGENFTVKVMVQDGETREHFWLSDTQLVDGSFHGILDAQPNQVTNVVEGQHWTAEMNEVTDWMYTRDGKMVGNYTLRAMLPHLPPNQAAKFGPLLADMDS